MGTVHKNTTGQNSTGYVWNFIYCIVRYLYIGKNYRNALYTSHLHLFSLSFLFFSPRFRETHANNPSFFYFQASDVTGGSLWHSPLLSAALYPSWANWRKVIRAARPVHPGRTEGKWHALRVLSAMLAMWSGARHDQGGQHGQGLPGGPQLPQGRRGRRSAQPNTPRHAQEGGREDAGGEGSDVGWFHHILPSAGISDSTRIY